MSTTTTIKSTLKAAQSILASEGTEQGKAFTAFHRESVKVWKQQGATIEQAEGERTLRASLDTYLAVAVGRLVARGKRVPADDKATLDNKGWASAYGVGGSTVTMWRNLGDAIMRANVDPNEASTKERMSTWRMLAFKGMATQADVSKAILAEGSTAETVRAAIVGKFLHEDGSRIEKPRGAQTGTNGQTKGAESDPEKAEAALRDADPVALALEYVKRLGETCKAIPVDDNEGWSKVETAIGKVLEREILNRSKANAKTATRKVAARKGAATRKAAAAKVPA